MVEKGQTNSDTYYPFSASPYYVADTFFGVDVYYATAYFVDPQIICNQVISINLGNVYEFWDSKINLFS